jgi:hypothetical protein
VTDQQPVALAVDDALTVSVGDAEPVGVPATTGVSVVL